MGRELASIFLPAGPDRWTSLLAAIVGVAGSFAFSGPTAAFVVTPVNSLVVDLTPGIIVIAMIQLLGTLSEVLALAVAITVTVLLLWGAAVVGLRAGRRTGDQFGVMLGVYFAGWTVAALLTRSPFTSLAPAVSMAITVGVREYSFTIERAATDTLSDQRRGVLKAVASLFGIVGLSTLVGLRRTHVRESPLTAIPAAQRETIEHLLRLSQRRSLDIDGIPSLVSTIDEFYEVDINTINPDVNVADWRLTITGAVETERILTYGDLTALQPEHRFETLRCVGDPLNGRLMDTALWTGVPIDPILQQANPKGTHVMLRAVDGYYEEFPLEALEEGFLAYGMNGRVLPRNHGYPVRALVPGHWGEINVKWLTEIEILDREEKGYWEKRGWHGTGPVNTVSKLWTVNHLDDGRIQVGGLAYAGTRGIRRIEVSVDGGDTWEEALLSPSLPDSDVWRQWEYEWLPSSGQHVVVVRAVDGDGTLQPRQDAQPYPRGATGWVTKTIRP